MFMLKTASICAKNNRSIKLLFHTSNYFYRIKINIYGVWGLGVFVNVAFKDNVLPTFYIRYKYR